MSLIESGLPTDWRDLQVKVHRILTECGMKAEIERSLTIARGVVEIDVFAEDPDPTPPAIYVCECKHWAAPIPQTVVHAFRTVVGESGANLGMIISLAGFQSGAHDAATYSNIRLLKWEEFQQLFCRRWFERYMLPVVHREADPLIEYTEPINSRISRKADALSAEAQREFGRLRKRWSTLALYFSILWREGSQAPSLPLRKVFASGTAQFDGALSDEILDAASLRGLLEVLVREYQGAIQDFDSVFGGRA